MDKKYKLKEEQNYTSDSAVQQILKDVDKWKSYNFPKTKYQG
jgi:hypothetical protein